MTDHTIGDVSDTDIALVGMAGRFPGADDVGALWETVRAGRSGITRFTDDELRAAGVTEELLADPAYVKAGAVIDGIEQFDAGFFGINPKEAQVLDPQHRLFLEHSAMALADAGCDPARFDGAIGVFAGAAWSSYLTNNLVPAGAAQDVGELTVALGNEKDCLPLRVAHLLGLTGPAFGVQSNCSTSLVAVCVAASSLANLECDLALAGGVALSVPHRVGYLYQPGGIAPPDGLCRAFDASGLGAPLGNGVAVVALRRLSDALADGDRVYAVLRGWAVNNDGGRKVGFTAPGVDGQAEVIAEALAAAGLDPADIDYVEAHGTGTALGDAAELAALQRVFHGEAVRVGSVKTNIGHLDRAAGVTGLIKTALALHHGELPPTLNLTEPNPQLAAGGAELEVVTERLPWPRGERTRRAGVSAFGIGGTNAHVVVEEAPVRVPPAAASRPELLVWSARTAPAVDQASAELAAHLAGTDDRLADVANTLQRGRAVYAHRRMLVAGTTGEAAAALRDGAAEARVDGRTDRPAGFLVAPLGAEYARVAAELYPHEPVFRAELDRCRDLLVARTGTDPFAEVLPAGHPVGAEPVGGGFAAGYALARLVLSWGVTPTALLGGGQLAATLAGVLELADALDLELGRNDPPAGELHPPTVPLLDPSTGAALDAATVTDPAYWAEPAGAPSARALAALLADGERAVVVIGAASDRTDPLLVPVLPDPEDSAPAALAGAAGRLWLLGVPLDWAGYQAGRELRRVGLPGYPFQRQRYWIDPPATPAAVPAGAPADGHVELLVQRWRPADATPTATAPGRYVLVPDAGGVADALADRLTRDGAQVRTVTDGDALATTLAEAPATVLHLAALDADQAGPAVLAAARTLADSAGDGGTATRVLVVTRGGQATGDGDPVHPAQAAVAALPVVANQEYLNLDARGVDLDPAYGPAEAAATLAAELGAAGAPVVARRADHRLVPGYDPAPAGAPARPVRPGGHYLITGGLGTVGLLLAGHLVRAGAGRITLTGRRGLPTDPADPRTAAVARLRALGADVRTPAVDVTDRDAMRRLLAAERVDGVVHAAAEADLDTFRPLRDLDPADVERHFRAKVDGARLLAELVAGLPAGQAPDWCVLFSSTSALLGGITLGSYAAANAALTALARTAPAGGTRWVAAAWDTWPGTLERLDGRIGAAMAAHAMTEAQALAAFDRLLAQPATAVVVAAGGLTDRLPAARDSADAETAPAPAAVRFPRPELPQPYAPPLTGTERELAEVWSTVLGVEPVGTRDNFFDLSGNSLLALRMLALVKERFGVAVPTVTLFELPTVQALARTLDERTGADRAAPAAVPQPAARPAAPADRSTVPAQPAVPAAQPKVSALSAALAALPRPAEPAVAAAAPRPAPAIVDDSELDRHVAVVGMAGRFPGAGDVAQFWRNLCDGVESISFFSTEEMIAAGVDPEVATSPSYVPARPVLDDITGFDAGFFGLSPRMAALTDPQQRLFLEVCWEALEQSGYCRPEHRGRVGVFGGCNLSTYLLGMADKFDSDEDVSTYELVMGNDKDALTTTVSYLFDLRGPSVAVQTFCSTSLVAVHTAIRSLRAGDCEMALAGGVSIRVPDRIGHLHSPGGMESPDGHVRTFDAQARGSMFGDGATVVVLKRLRDALRDGDHIWSVIRGSALNNDGAAKVGYTAPSVGGQAAVIADALVDARVTAEDIGYVEAHGTATELGDPIEVTALTRAFGPTRERQYCPIGSVKTNIGHLDRAAGTAGLIKTSLVVRSGVIPPTLHYTSPNPQIDFANSPFYVNAALNPWRSDPERPRIAGLNSLGMGGTNVHVVVQEPPARPAPPAPDPGTGRRYQVLPVSARTAEAADEAVRRLGAHLREQPELRLADVAYTLQVGRKTFEHRRVAVAADAAGAVATLTGADGAPPVAGRVDSVQGRPVAFLFTGVGEQYPGLVGELYRREPVFRATLDECLAPLAELLPDVDVADLLTGARGGGPDLAALLGRGGTTDPRAERLRRTEVVQPVLFAVGYALATTLVSWGVRPTLMLGYSLGEYVAACLSGVLSPTDALALVAYRARLIAGLPRGAMAAVPLAADALRQRFDLAGRGVDVAAVNGPEVTVVAGPPAAVDALAADLAAADVPCRPLETSHAFHSRMLAPIAAELTAWIAAHVRLNPPTVPYLSNVTGGRADAELVCDPAYWARHMCEPVQFAAAAAELLADEQLAVVEVGPGQSLGALLRGAGAPPQRWATITATLPAAGDPRPADAVLADCLGRLWLLGVEVDWTAHHGRDRADCPEYAGAAPGRIPLPTYPFQRQRYWIPRTAPGARREATAELPPAGNPLEEFDRIPLLPEERWIHQPVWRQTVAPAPAADAPGSWLVYSRPGTADGVLAELRAAAGRTGARVTVVRPGPVFRAAGSEYTVRPGDLADTLELLRGLRADGTRLERVVHLWTLDEPTGELPDTLALGLHTLVALARSASERGLDGWTLDMVTSGAQRVLDDRELRPDAATLAGPSMVVPMEYPTVTTRLIDVPPDGAPADVVAELFRPVTDRTVALRGGRRWLLGYEVVPPPAEERTAAVLRERGVYLITGGLGGIALGLAEQLARQCRARLVLLGRTGLPDPRRWDAIDAGTDQVPEQTRARVAAVRRLVELGAEVEVVVGDVAEAADVRRAVAVARERFGDLHGVLHTAGVPGTGLMQFKQSGDADQVLAPKVAGTLALADALRLGRPDEAELDFLVLFSSITSVTGGGPGQVDYCAANAWLDAYAPRHAGPGRRLLAVSWGEWTWNAWDDGLSGYEEGIQTFFREHRAKFGIDFAAGWRTLLRAIASDAAHVVVSTQDLPAVVRLAERFTVEAVTSPVGGADPGDRHPRPDLVTPYQEPESPAERTIAEAWCQALRIDRVGVVDNFFELGGTSLLGITLLAALRRSFPEADLPPHVIHEAPTVAALAKVVDGTTVEETRDVEAQGQLRRSGLRAAAARRRRP
jgi:acyl transferase domain-containing protein/acyl carrier protein